MFTLWFLRQTTTSETVCAMRAYLYSIPKHPLKAYFQDPYASQLCGYPWRLFFRIPPLTYILGRWIFRDVEGGSSIIALRSYLTEKYITDFLNHGGKQVVMVASGLDSFQLRSKKLLSNMHLYEIDTPEMIAKKRKRIQKIVGHIHPSCHFIEAKLNENLPISAALTQSSIDSKSPVFFSILGLSYYLKRDTFFLCIKDLADSFAEGSMIAVDYLITDEQLSSKEKSYKKQIKFWVDFMGETMFFDISPQELEQKMSALSFQKVSDTVLSSLYSQYELTDHATAQPSAYSLGVFVKTKS